MNSIKKTMKQKKILIIAILTIVVLLGVQCITGKKAPSEVQSNSNMITVEVKEVSKTDFKSTITYKAELAPAEDAIISSNIAGQVTQVLFENGQQVTKGQALAYLDNKDLQTQLRTAEIDLDKLELELASTENDYYTAKELYENGACSKHDYDNAKLTYQTMLSNVESKKVEIQNIQRSINDSVIKAEITGEIGNKSISIGQYVNPGTTIATIQDNSSIKATIQLLQEDLDKVVVGQQVELKRSENDEKTYLGIVENIATSANSETRVFECLIRLDNTSRELNSGISAYVQIPNNESTKVIAIPTSAIIGSEGDYSVYKEENHVANKVAVTLGKMTDELVEITSGIQEGDQVIVTNLNSLHNGDRVTISKGEK